MTGSYVAEVTRGLGGIMKCYIAGVQCFCNTLETVAEELCGKKYYRTLPHNPADKEVKDAEADFYKTLNKFFDSSFQKLETEAEKVGQKHGKSTQAEIYRRFQKRLEDEGQKSLNVLFEGYSGTLIESTVADKEAKEKEAKSHQSLSKDPENTKKLEEAMKEIEELKKEIAVLRKSQK